MLRAEGLVVRLQGVGVGREESLVETPMVLVNTRENFVHRPIIGNGRDPLASGLRLALGFLVTGHFRGDLNGGAGDAEVLVNQTLKSILCQHRCHHVDIPIQNDE